MTFPIGTKVKISVRSPYFYKQGRSKENEGPQIVGIVIENAHSEDWPTGWLGMGWDTKVQWPYHNENPRHFNVYNSEKDLIPLFPSNKTFNDYM